MAQASESASLSGYFRLEKDISLTSGKWMPVGSAAYPFAGEFDGNGHTISGINISGAEYADVGLFGVNSGTIKDLNVSVTLDGGTRTGAIAGNNRGTIENCTSEGTVSGGSENTGGLVGNNSGTVTKCESSATVSSTGNNAGGLAGTNNSGGTITLSHASGSVTGNNAGGLIGLNYSEDSTAVIRYSYAVGNISGTDAGGLVGENNTYSYYNRNSSTFIEYCYALGTVTGSSHGGGLVGYNVHTGYGTRSSLISFSYAAGLINNGIGAGLVGGTDGTVRYCYYNVSNTGNNRGFGISTSLLRSNSSSTYYGWDFTNVWNWASDTNRGYPYIDLRGEASPVSISGYGDEIEPYIIENEKQLFAMVTGELPTSGVWYRLANDIEVTARFWTPIGGNGTDTFNSTFDGDGHTISGIKLSNSEYADYGLFGVNSGTIKDLNVSVILDGGTRTGAIVGNNSGTIENCTSEGTVSGGSDSTGGLVGNNSGTVTKCESSATVTSTGNHAGGLAGTNNSGGTITLSHATGSVTGNNAGGLVGLNYSYESASATVIRYSYATGNVSGTDAGGLVGRNNPNSYNSSTFIEYCYALGTVTGSSHGGGLVGYNVHTGYGTRSSLINYCYSTGSVAQQGTYGGLIGSNDGTVTASYYDSTVSGCEDTDRGTPASTADMKVQKTYDGWDFGAVWKIESNVNGGYPYLQDIQPVATPVSGISLNKSSISLSEGGSESLIFSITPNGASDKTVIWTSDNNDVAAVDSNGRVTGIKAGTATITVTTKDGGYTASCAVTVNTEGIAVTGLTLNRTTLTLGVGGAAVLTPNVLPVNATDKTVGWTSSNEGVVTVDNDGVVTGVAGGTAVITATTSDGGRTATCIVTVEAQSQDGQTHPVTSVTLDRSALNMTVGETVSLTATVLPEDAENKNVSWLSSNEAVVTVVRGVITAKGAGNATVTVLTEDGKKTAACDIAVKARPDNLESLELSGLEKTVFVVGQSLELPGFTVTAVYSDGTRMVVKDYDISGYNSKQTGEQVLTVAYGGVENQFTVTVTERALESISIVKKPAKLNYYIGDSQLDDTGMELLATYNNGDTGVITSGWSLSGYDSSAAREQRIIVTYGGCSDSFYITVNERSGGMSVERPVPSVESFMGGKRVSLSCATNGAVIHYTLNGEAPTGESEVFNPGDTIEFRETKTLKAVAVLNGATSRTLSVQINVSQLSTPEADPNTASVQKGSIVTLRTGVAGATVFYTLDGSTPDENSLIYSSGIIINDNVTLKAVAMKDGYANSQEFTRSYTVAPSQVPEDSVIVSLGSVKAAAGDTASVPVYVFTDGSKITNMRISVAFDSGSFDNAVTVTPADGVDPSSLFAAVNQGNVTLRYDGEALDNGEICTLNITPLASRGGSVCDIEVVLDASAISTTSVAEANLSAVNASITVDKAREARFKSQTNFYSSDGKDLNSVEDLNGAKEFEVNASVVYEDEVTDVEFRTGTVIVALYNKRNMLIKVDSWEVDLTDNSFLSMRSISIPDNVQLGRVKVMALSEDFIPLVMASEI